MNPFLVGARLALSDYDNFKDVKLPLGVRSGIKTALKYNKLYWLIRFHFVLNYVLTGILWIAKRT